jgi:hypothetical protein
MIPARRGARALTGRTDVAHHAIGGIQMKYPGRVSSGSVLALASASAAALGIWLVVRFPQHGPKHLRSALVALGVATFALGVGAPMADAVSDIGLYGPALALLLIAVPSITAAFWAGGCFVRLVLSGATS